MPHHLAHRLTGSTRGLATPRILYGTGRSLPQVVSGLYEKLDELRKLYGCESIEEILDLTIDPKDVSREHLAELARQKAQSPDIRAKAL
jgi:hypothetical protein